MDSSTTLLDVAARLADGTAVDWDSAARSIDDDEDRRLLGELRFIADLTRRPGGDPPAPVTSSTTWGPLKIIEHVGRGSFGDVYRAWDTRLDREVALKILRRAEDAVSHDASVIQEGRRLARVRHPNVVSVYGAERVNGQVGVWMEFVPGRTLEAQLRDEGLFDLDRVIGIGIDLAGALTTVHRAGLIHRDVKAQNVLCDGDGRLVLTDFGAGCELQETTAGTLAGTPTSVAPELLQGSKATPQSDVYGLGVLMYHLVTGTYPVMGGSLKEIRDAHALGRRISLADARPDLPDAFVRVVDRAIDPNPVNRYKNPEALQSALQSFASPRVRRWVLPLAGALVAAVVLWFVDSRTDQPLNPEQELTEIVTLTERGRLEDAYERALRARSAAPGSPAAANAAAYVLTYAGFLEDAAKVIDELAAARPDYMKENGWWTPTALLYRQQIDRFLQSIGTTDTSSDRLYRAIAEVERGRRENAVLVLAGIDGSKTDLFSRLASALDAALAGRQDAVSSIMRSIRDQRRAAGDGDGEITFKQAQILSLAGDGRSAVSLLDEAVGQGFVCVSCFELSALLQPVRELPEYQRVRERARARHLAFGRRFDLASPQS